MTWECKGETMSGLPTMTRVLPLLLICLSLPAATFSQDCLDYPAQPRWLGDPGLGECTDLAPAGAGLLAALQGTVLRIHDIGDPLHPTTWDEMELGVGARYLTVEQGVAYVSGDPDGVLGVRAVVIDPLGGLLMAPVILGPEPAGRIAASGPLLGVCLVDSFSLWDVSDPLLPVRLATVNDGVGHEYMAMVGSRLVTSDAAGAVRIYDLADPTAPALVGGWPAVTGHTAGLVMTGGVVGELVYTYSDGGSWIYGDRWYHRSYNLRCLDVGDPAVPVQVGAHDLGDSFASPLSAWHRVWCSGGRILAATGSSSGLKIVDPAEPALAVTLPLNGAVLATAWQDGQVFASWSEGASGAWTVPPAPRNEPIPAPPADVWVSDILYQETNLVLRSATQGDLVAALCEHTEWDYRGGELWYNWVDLYATGVALDEPAAHLDLYAEDIALAGSRLYLAGGSLQSVDVGDPFAPGLPRTIPGISGAKAVEPLDGDLLAVALGSGTLQIWDLGDDLAPLLVGSCPIAAESWGAVDMVRDGDRLLIASELGESTVMVVDASDPAQPTESGRFTPGLGRKVMRLDRLADGRLLANVSGPDRRTMLIDHTDATAPFLVAEVSVPWEVYDVQVHAGRIYQLGNGLHELRSDDLSVLGGVPTARPVVGGASVGGQLLAVGTQALMVLPAECALAPVTDDDAVPAPPAVLAVWPNPFNPRTTVAFALREARAVRLAVYDLRGRQVCVLAEGRWAAGEHVAVWDGRGADGRMAGSGTYLLRLEAGPESATAAMTLLR